MKKINLLLMVVISANIFAQQPQLQPLPMDPKIRYGKLDNGLTYYIRHNQEPKQRAEFHIAQNVGAILEEDNQNGLAHFLEHMAFNGTKNFPDKGIINYFEKIGVKFGYDINAYTSLDETVYRLSNVPTMRSGIIDSALLVMHDWSSSILLKSEEIDSERGVIREEWRTGNNARRRLWKEINKQKYTGSQYAKRDIIGDTAVINNFTYQAIRDYYKKWYKPDQQAIVVVGDIDVDKIEAKIKELFANIPRSEYYGVRPIHSVENNKEPIVAIATDPEASQSQIAMEYKQEKLPKEVQLSIAGYAKGTVDNIINGVFAERFQEISLQADAPFAAAYAYDGSMIKAKDAFNLVVIPKQGKEIEGMKSLMLEAEKAKRFGFTNAEVDRAKTNILKGLEKAYNERDNQNSQDLAEEYIRHYLDNESITGIEAEYQMAQMIMPQITSEAINETIKSYITDENLIISVTAPEKAEVKVPTKAQIIEALADVKKAELTAKAEEISVKSLMEKTPLAGVVKSISKNSAIETTEMVLSNGIKLVFKPTTFKKDEIKLTAFSQGGLSKVHNVADLPSAMIATGIVQANGIGEFGATELKKVLTGKIASAAPYISTYEEGINANSSVKDFETMLQLVNLHFTQPRKDDNSFNALLNMYRTQLANAEKNPNKIFSDSVRLTLSNNDPRTIIQNLKMIDKINQDKALEIYKQRFANPADFTFMFVGNIDPLDTNTQKLLATYLGSLKVSDKKEKFDKVYRETPKGVVKNYFEQEMKTKKASNRIQYSGKLPYNISTSTIVGAIGDILDIRYLESIREKEGGSYGVGVRGSVVNTPSHKAMLLMQFDTDPEKQEKLIGIIHQEVNEIIKNGTKADDLTKIKENLIKQYTQDLEQNDWWMGALKDFYADKINYRTDYKAAVENLSSQSIQKTLKAIVKQGNLIEVVMKPKN